MKILKKISVSPLFLILLLAFVLRLYGIDWDKGGHLHPDERMLIMVADRVNFFKQLNPDFFNYGSLPIYLLKGISQLIDTLFSTHLAYYDGMLYVGRYLSIFADLLTIIFIYKISQLLFSKQNRLRAKSRSLNNIIPLMSSFFYTIAFFSIQNSHFFVVDVFLTCFITILIYLLINYLKRPSFKNSLFISIVLAACLATKVTPIIFLPIIYIVLFMPIASRQARMTIKQLTINFLIFNFSLLTFNFLFMPYAFIEHKRFISDVLAQISMNSNPYVFPYTLQYVDTIPYFYYLKNIFFWGFGPVISTLSLLGVLFFLKRSTFNVQRLTYFIFYLFYFLIIGRSAVKFMRYMLPLYPFFAIMAGLALYRLYGPTLSVSKLYRLLTYTIVITALVWSFMFINIYSQPHTRIAATNWIMKNIPAGSTLAYEHWDDRVPLYGGERYNYVEMGLYEQPDDENKWSMLNQRLKQADYIILASNRLYVPLQRLADCQKYKSCYPKTAEYYRRLFNEGNVILDLFQDPTINNEMPIPSNSGRHDMVVKFKKAAEFAAYPTLKIGSLTFKINDQGADESFTVYDHPKIIIFKKI